MNKNKFLILISLAFLTLLLCSMASATEKPVLVSFLATKPDTENNFTVKMSISNATFNAFQFVLRYDTKTLEPINSDTKEAAESFNDFAELNTTAMSAFSSIGTGLDEENGLVDFTHFIFPGNSFYHDAPKKENKANIGSNAYLFYTFHFRLLNDQKPVIFELGTEDDFKPYQTYFPQGAAFVDDNGFLLIEVVFDLVQLEQAKFHEKEEQDIPSGTEKDEEETIIIPEEPQSPSDNEVKRPKTTTERLQNTLILQIGNYAAATDGALCHIDPREKSVVPYIKNDRTYLPFRFIAERLGFEVMWDNKTRSVTFYDEEQILVLVIGEKKYTKNGEVHPIEVAAEITNDRTMVPVRFVAEALGFAVEWDANQKMVFITSRELPWLLDDKIEQEATSDVAFTISPLVRDFYLEEGS